MTSRSGRARTRQAILGAAAAVLLLSACAADDDQTLAEEPAAEAAAGADVLPTVSGSQIDVGSLEGTDTILWFWAPW